MEKGNHLLTGATFLAAAGAIAYTQAPHELNQYLPEITDKAVFCISFLATTPLPDIDQKIRYLEHRTLTHCLLFLVPFIYLGTLYTPLLGMAFGVFHHLLIDNLSNQGVPWLWPLQKFIRYPDGKKVVNGHHLRLYRSKSPAETMWAIIISLFNIAVCAMFLLDHFKLIDVL